MNKRRLFLKKLADLLKIDISPVNEIHKLEDRRDVVYLWDLNCTDQQAEGLKKRIKSEFIQRNNRDPQAIHVVLNNVDSFSEMGPGQIREVFGPWLDQAQKTEGKNQ